MKANTQPDEDPSHVAYFANSKQLRFNEPRRCELPITFKHPYNPTRLSGVSVYYEAERAFAAGDRLQIRAPFREKRIANGELGTITKIEPDQIRLAMDSGREISVHLRKFRHLDYGYAVTSYSARGLTFDRVLVNADTQEYPRPAQRRRPNVPRSVKERRSTTGDITKARI